jgi:hypothetical protein
MISVTVPNDNRLVLPQTEPYQSFPGIGSHLLFARVFAGAVRQAAMQNRFPDASAQTRGNPHLPCHRLRISGREIMAIKDFAPPAVREIRQQTMKIGTLDDLGDHRRCLRFWVRDMIRFPMPRAIRNVTVVAASAMPRTICR